MANTLVEQTMNQMPKWYLDVITAGGGRYNQGNNTMFGDNVNLFDTESFGGMTNPANLWMTGAGDNAFTQILGSDKVNEGITGSIAARLNDEYAIDKKLKELGYSLEQRKAFRHKFSGASSNLFAGVDPLNTKYPLLNQVGNNFVSTVGAIPSVIQSSLQEGLTGLGNKLGMNFPAGGSVTDVLNSAKGAEYALGFGSNTRDAASRILASEGVSQQDIDSIFKNSNTGQSLPNYSNSFREGPMFDFGGKLHNLFNNPSSIDITALGGPRAKGNIFNQGQIEAEDYTTKKNRVLAERAAEQQRIAEQQRVAEQQRIKQQQSINPVAGIPQGEYQTRMDDVYKNVVVDNAGNTGYTGTGDQGRGAYFQTPAYRGQQAAAAVDRKAKSMGVASPVRRTPGTKYGFGL